MKRKPANTNRAKGPASAAMDGKPSIAGTQTAIQPACKMPQLTPQKIRTAWTRLGKTIQEFCRQPSRKCTLCLVSEDKIVFRNSSDPTHCELRLKDNIIVRQFGDVCDYFEIVLIKGHGIAYEVSERRLSATLCWFLHLEDILQVAPVVTGEQYRREIRRLGDAIEEDSKAIVRLLQACGSGSNFGPEQRLAFEELLLHRQQLKHELRHLSDPMFL